MTFEAVYENGVLRPLESLALPNLQHVLVTIASAPATADDVAGYFEELDRYSARPLWLVVGHAYRGEDTVLTRYLGRDRAVRATVMADGAFARLYAPDTEPADAVVRPLPSYADHGLECRK